MITAKEAKKLMHRRLDTDNLIKQDLSDLDLIIKKHANEGKNSVNVLLKTLDTCERLRNLGYIVVSGTGATVDIKWVMHDRC